jgi:hypothetical protein
MKYRHFLQVNEATLPKSAFAEICAIAPEGLKPYGFKLQIDSDFPDGGEIVCKVINVCTSNGLSRRERYGPNSYGHNADRWYSDEEFRSAEFLILKRQPQIQSVTEPDHDEQGRLWLLGKNAKPNRKIGSVYPNHIVISDAVKQLLEPGGFIGLQFGEVAVKGKLAEEMAGQLWELQSSVVLPKMANVHQFIHPGRTEPEPFQGDYSKIIMLNDPPFNKGEVHYRRSELTALGAFDIARTFENYMEPLPALVISQRFYQYCLKNKIKLDADPVRIDPD